MHPPSVPAVVLALAAAVSPPAVVAAQPAQGAVAGTVVAEGSQRPIADAQVSVEGSPLAAATDASGRFRIAGVTGAEVRLTVRRIGYRPATVTARVGATDVRVVLGERALELSQVVVTGTAGAQERRAIGNAVSTVRASDVVATQPVRNVQDLLTGRAAGVSVVASSGQVGTGSRIRVRGASSLSLSNDPLIYVDGVRVDNAQATGPNQQGFGSASISRFNDFNPNDIESIEIIKGPAAATLYGTEASNGVVQIITKKGAAGRATFNAVARLGSSWLPGWRGGYGYVNYGAVARAGAPGVLDTVSITAAQLNDSLNARFGEDIFRTGGQRSLQTAISGGAAALRYYVGLSRDEEEGVERENRLHRTSVRANLTASPWRAVDVQSSLGYVTGRTYLPYEAGGGGAAWGTFFSSPQFLYNSPGTAAQTPGNPQLGFRSGPPDVYYQAYTVFQQLSRFTGAITVTNRPASWLDHRFILGLDQTDEDNQEQQPRNDVIGTTYASFSGLTGANAGFLGVGTRNVRYASADYALTARAPLPGGWQSVTSVGGPVLRPAGARPGALRLGVPRVGHPVARRRRDPAPRRGQRLRQQHARRLRAAAAGVEGPPLPHRRRAARRQLGLRHRLPGGHVPEAERLVRGERGARAADSRALQHAAAARRLRRERAAARRVRRHPTYNATGGALTPQNAGNPDLGPEKSYETELGLDAGVLQDRLSLELTYYAGRTEDAILSRGAAPSNGFPGFQLFNAGRVDRRGLEWTVRGRAVERRGSASSSRSTAA
jgi:TonB-dependent SusC/RagA subfamily outer membrane receptor